MKRLIITDEKGRIIGTAPHPSELKLGEKGGPSGFRIVAQKGQRVHEVLLPKSIRTVEDLQELHEKYIVQADSQLIPLGNDASDSSQAV